MEQTLIQQAFHGQPVQLIDGKRYCFNTLTDHTPITQPELLHQIVAGIKRQVDFTKADCIIGEEDRGGYLAAIMSYATGKPFTLTKWNPIGLSGEVGIDFRNTYTTGKLYLNGISQLHNKEAVIVEDIIDSGGTVIAMVKLLRKYGINVKEIVAVAEKTDYGGVDKIYQATGILPKTLVRFATNNNNSFLIN